MKRPLMNVLLLVFTLSFAAADAAADTRIKSVCPGLRDFPVTNRPVKCFTSHTCRVGVRGDWLDLTDQATVVSGPRASVRILATGVDEGASGNCIPRANKSREGYVSVLLTDIEGTGEMRIRLSRPAFGGRDSDEITVDVLSGDAYLEPRSYSAVVNQPKTLRLEGKSLNLLELTDAAGAGAEIVEQTSERATVRLTFTSTGTMSLENVVRFAGARPRLNELMEWPTVSVTRAAAAGGGVNAGVGGPIGGGRSTQSSEPNLTPAHLFGNRPLLRKINNFRQIEVPGTFCASHGNNEEREVDVPPFEWGVSNDNRSDVQTPFTVQLIDGSSGTVLATQQMNALREGRTESFRNWPNRPSRIRVVKVTGPPLMAQYGNATGCYLVSSVALDPRPIIIRVDAGGSVTERVENDNDLPVN